MKTTGTQVKGLVAVAILIMSGAAMAKPAAKKELTGVVNLNTATAAQLDLLPGVGAKAAKRIIEHRTKTPFAKVEDLSKVKGFGPKKLEKLKRFVTVSGPTTAALKKKADDAPSTAGPAPSAQGRRSGGKR